MEGRQQATPVGDPVSEGASALQGQILTNFGELFKQLEDHVKQLHKNILEVEEDNKKAAATYELEKKEFAEVHASLLRRFEKIDRKIETEVQQLKSKYVELENGLQEEHMQRQKVEENYVAEITELKTLISERDDFLLPLNQKIDVLCSDLSSYKEQVQQQLEQQWLYATKIDNLSRDIQIFKSRFQEDIGNTATSQTKNAEKFSEKHQLVCDNDIQLQDISAEKTEFSLADETQSDESEEELGDILDHFVTTTSMHGIGQIIGNKWLVLRILWILLTLGALGGLILHLYSIIDSFHKWPKQTQVSVGLTNSIYPAITVCNENIVRKDALENMEQLKTLNQFVKFVNHIISSENYTKMDSPNSYSMQSLKDYFETLYGNLQLTDDERFIIETALNRSMYNDHESDRDISYILEEIFQTVYMNVDRNFTHYQTSSLGNCWTISNPSMTAETTGPRAGLSLVLFLQNHEALEGITNGYGARLAIHSQGTKPIPTEEGILISSASETNIGLSKGVITRVGFPHGRCNDGTKFREAYGFLYSRQVCQIMCLLEGILGTCGCYGNFHEEFAILINETAHVCNTTQERRCLNDFLYRDFEVKTQTCICDNPCRETYFYTSVSTRQWPTDTYAHMLLEKVCRRDLTACQKLKEIADSRHLQNNFVKINIFFETLNYEEIEEKPLMDAFQLLADIGGALGLWVGLSVLSFCEIVQLVIKLLDFMLCPQKCIHVPPPKT